MIDGLTKQSSRALYQIAADQGGYFTTKQAIEAGFSDTTHSYHIQNGDWIREFRGIYRLTDFPQGKRPELMLWYLWSRDITGRPQGVYSYDTALDMYELSDLMPDKLHMTVPRSFRKRLDTANGLKIHYAELSPGEARYYYGVHVTSPLRTIADIIQEDSIPQSMIKQAIAQAIERGLIDKKSVEEMQIIVPNQVKETLYRLYKEVKENRRKKNPFIG
jgi:predicted transcriptional regulator of viral defense system